MAGKGVSYEAVNYFRLVSHFPFVTGISLCKFSAPPEPPGAAPCPVPGRPSAHSSSDREAAVHTCTTPLAGCSTLLPFRYRIPSHRIVSSLVLVSPTKSHTNRLCSVVLTPAAQAAALPASLCLCWVSLLFEEHLWCHLCTLSALDFYFPHKYLLY